MPTDWIRQLQERFVAESLSGSPAIRPLPAEEAQAHAARALKETRGAKEVDEAIRGRGLAPMVVRARAYAPFSYTTGRVRMVCVVPYTSPDRTSPLVGTVGISEGEPASGVVVEMAGAAVTRATIYDFIGGRLIEKAVPAADLLRDGPKKFVERWKREKVEPNLPAETAMEIGRHAFQTLLIDDFASIVYSEDDVRQLAHNAPVITALAELQHMRHLGVPTADSCCCCCTCSWGCCSSCSAVADSYLSPAYGRGT
jgi:hypothetical protein